MAQINLKLATEELKDVVASKIHEGDIVHKVFLKPIELVLKTNKVKKEL
jgi:hypothetical protein